MSKPSAARYRTTNLSSYTASLKRRGSLLLWLDPAFRAIATACPNVSLALFRDGERWQLRHATGCTLARLSRVFMPPEGPTFLRGKVDAVLRWRKEHGDAEYHHQHRREEWGVILPEQAFEGKG